MKKDLKLLLWYILCPTYVLWLILFVILFIIQVVLVLCKFKYFPEKLDAIACYPFELLDKLKK